MARAHKGSLYALYGTLAIAVVIRLALHAWVGPRPGHIVAEAGDRFGLAAGATNLVEMTERGFRIGGRVHKSVLGAGLWDRSVGWLAWQVSLRSAGGSGAVFGGLGGVAVVLALVDAAVAACIYALARRPGLQSSSHGSGDAYCSWLAALFVLNPISIAASVQCSLCSFGHLGVALALCCAQAGFSAPAVVLSAAVVAVIPSRMAALGILASLAAGAVAPLEPSKRFGTPVLASGAVGLAAALLAALQVAPRSTQLQPNMGVLWYVNSVAFPDLAGLYGAAARGAVLIVATPAVTYGLGWVRRRPLASAAVLHLAATTFDADPVAPDFCFSYALIAARFRHDLAAYPRLALAWMVVVATTYSIYCIAMDQWVVRGTGNANQPFFATLILASANIALITFALRCAYGQRPEGVAGNDTTGNASAARSTAARKIEYCTK